MFESYKVTLVRVTIELPNGDLSTGSAFHIGDGWLATAAHVVNSGELVEVVSERYSKKLEVEEIIYHDDERIDLALLKTNLDLTHHLETIFLPPPADGFIHTDHIPIGGHLDDWVGDEFILSRVLLMGYPPVPFSRSPILVAAEGEVNAVLDKYTGDPVHFIISCMPRGGFSGGPVLSEYGFLLGIMTESLNHNDGFAETGFASVLSIEPLLVLLEKNGIYPGENREMVEMVSFSDDPTST
ncbi:serine protease [Pseudodesulfovibrio sp. zrk46]|uniref:S1 family peptidase n=1 Tax=Pseudodesulfovibrio sp. zrk46 TaxID=2725288 RepID=UPI0014495201|nr:serine protease [Pseudodesulfovibrio sp. zrk46]QJB55922.1 trypsin-like peptidase domain-containing protein [Pseudodesulfovibrio sp. zrk46]